MAVTLSSGFKMPLVGFGVWRVEGKDMKDLVINAIKIGYRHFDCAADYKNETEVGEALAVGAFQSGLVKREDLFITTKLWNSDHGHCSNYDIFLTRDCLAYSKVKPAVNQIETHPYFQRDSLVKFCLKHGVSITAHTPLGGAAANTEWFGSVSCLDDPVLKGLAAKYKRTVAQIVLRWGIQRNTVVIPKTSNLKRLEENFQVFDFELTKEDMDQIKSLDRKHRTNTPGKFWGIDLYA
ncbi:LOW QUALITY PROTEIN: NADP-dependent D-sorbitol-6-phosphate dehydrogenase [Quercus suber]|uniref:LOW QUALITY PROTEIN: NADP-dependent D-sorbitol-6-phosphate dehydrogenase n=1 Tax=Quercus suber TaxID=58331 RepID=UPI0032DF6839